MILNICITSSGLASPIISLSLQIIDFEIIRLFKKIIYTLYNTIITLNWGLAFQMDLFCFTSQKLYLLEFTHMNTAIAQQTNMLKLSQGLIRNNC